MQRLGILGGTFDPVHNGHVHTAVALADYVRLDRLHMVPCFQPVHRDTPSTPAEHRLAMLQQACKVHPKLQADDRELQRGGPSYSIDTVHAFRAEYPDAVIFMVMGADAFRQFHTWRNADEFLSVVNIVVVHRGGEPAPDLAASNWAQAIHDNPSDIQCSRGALSSVQLPLWATSSTAIRQRLQQGEGIENDVPSAVAQYIELHKLYR